MSLETVLTAVVGAMKRTCKNTEAIPGPMDKDTLAKLISTAPAMRIAPIGVVAAEAVGNGQTDFTVQFAAYLLTKPSRPADVSDTLAMVGAIMTMLPQSSWGLAMAHPVDDATIRAETLSTADILAKGVSLWAITWRQALRLGLDQWAGDAIAFPSVADARYDEGQFVETAVDLRGGATDAE